MFIPVGRKVGVLLVVAAGMLSSTITPVASVSAANISLSQVGAGINGEELNDQSGWSVSLSADGSRMAIGAPGNGIDSGHVRVYQLVNNAWVKLGDDIDGETDGDYSGWSVSLSADGSRVAIGAPYNNEGGDDAGHVRVYSWNGTAWVPLGDDIDGETDGDRSGYSVSLSGDGSRVAIGAPNNDGGGDDAGHVRART